jgi:hypothetical protein
LERTELYRPEREKPVAEIPQKEGKKKKMRHLNEM